MHDLARWAWRRFLHDGDLRAWVQSMLLLAYHVLLIVVEAGLMGALPTYRVLQSESTGIRRHLVHSYIRYVHVLESTVIYGALARGQSWWASSNTAWIEHELRVVESRWLLVNHAQCSVGTRSHSYVLIIDVKVFLCLHTVHSVRHPSHLRLIFRIWAYLTSLVILLHGWDFTWCYSWVDARSRQELARSCPHTWVLSFVLGCLSVTAWI